MIQFIITNSPHPHHRRFIENIVENTKYAEIRVEGLISSGPLAIAFDPLLTLSGFLICLHAQVV